MSVLENGVDEQLLVARAQRDPAQFAELYESNFERVYAYVARRVPTRQDAEDLTSEVFHEALRGLPQFEWRGLPFVAWLLGIARRRLAERWRRNGKRQETAFDDTEEGAVEAGIEEAVALFQLVNDLPADQRLVIRRRFVEQKSLREIAEELGRSEGAIKQLQFRALQQLRSKMGQRHV